MTSPVSAALTEPDPRLDGIPTAAIRRELRRRKLASRTRDVRANPGNINGVHKPPEECAAAVRRQILAYARRIAAGNDVAALAGLAALHAVVEEAVGVACRELTRPGHYSWAEVAAGLGTGKQSAWDSYHNPDGTRRPRGTQLRERQPS